MSDSIGIERGDYKGSHPCIGCRQEVPNHESFSLHTINGQLWCHVNIDCVIRFTREFGNTYRTRRRQRDIERAMVADVHGRP